MVGINQNFDYRASIFIILLIGISIIVVDDAYAGEFPNKTTKEEPKPQEPEQKPEELEETVPVETPQSKGGGCLIATAAYGTELAPQVQLLREVRDNVLFSTGSGTSFMTAFDAVYYTFSPTIADWERQNSAFKETVRIAITPMLSTLSVLNYVEIDSEQEMVGYGIGIILLNVGMYFALPAFLILGSRKLLKMQRVSKE